MGIEKFLTHEDKVESLLALREKLITDITRLVSELGIDESSFSISEYSLSEDRSDLPRMVKEGTLHRHCQLVLSIDNKVEELNNG